MEEGHECQETNLLMYTIYRGGAGLYPSTHTFTSAKGGELIIYYIVINLKLQPLLLVFTLFLSLSSRVVAHGRPS